MSRNEEGALVNLRAFLRKLSNIKSLVVLNHVATLVITVKVKNLSGFEEGSLTLGNVET